MMNTTTPHTARFMMMPPSSTEGYSIVMLPHPCTPSTLVTLLDDLLHRTNRLAAVAR